MDAHAVSLDNDGIKDRTNPYAEVSLLMNNTGYILISAGMYWICTKYQIDENSQAVQETKLKRDGLKRTPGLAL